jgi:hypothetical protein
MKKNQAKSRRSPTGSGRGGARPGAGRKPGSQNKRTKVIAAIAEKVAAGETGATPLEILTETMYWLRDRAREDKPYVEGKGQSAKVYSPLQLRMLAAETAAKAAPYVHPRLANVGTPQNPVGVEDYLKALAAESESDGADAGSAGAAA